MTDTAHPLRKAGPARRPRLAVLAFVLVYAAAMLLLFAPKDMLGTIPASLIQPDD